MEIELKNGLKLLVDDADWQRYELGKYNWGVCHHTKGGVSVMTTIWCKETKRTKALRIHRLIMDARGGEMVDHINGNPLDNRRRNLRIATNAQNQQNSGSRSGTSKYKGVAWFARRKKWRVSFNWNGKTYFVGYFDDEVEAAKAYNAAILPLAGEFARLNPIP